MNNDDLVLVEAQGQICYGRFVERLPTDRLCSIEILKEKVGDEFKSPKQPGIKLITKQKFVTVIFKAGELGARRPHSFTEQDSQK